MMRSLFLLALWMMESLVLDRLERLQIGFPVGWLAGLWEWLLDLSILAQIVACILCLRGMSAPAPGKRLGFAIALDVAALAFRLAILASDSPPPVVFVLLDLAFPLHVLAVACFGLYIMGLARALETRLPRKAASMILGLAALAAAARLTTAVLEQGPLYVDGWLYASTVILLAAMFWSAARLRKAALKSAIVAKV
jgi:hypothetical protein